MTVLHELLRNEFLDLAGPLYQRLRIAAHNYRRFSGRQGTSERRAFARLCCACWDFSSLLRDWAGLGMGLDDLAPEWCSRQRQLMEAAVEAYRVHPDTLSREETMRLIERLKAAAVAV